jgi:hypothetical protein
VATLAPNLDRARTAIRAAFPGTIVYWIGDQAHAASRSDHNPDSRGIVHAIDVMAAAGTAAAKAVVHCALSRVDLQYVIHDRTIWSRNSGWAPQPYTGSDPHTDHVHISGKHGTVGATSSTEAGYDVAAEQDQTPWVFALQEAAVNISDTDAQYLCWRGEALTHLYDTVREGPEKGAPVQLVRAIKDIQARVGAPAPVALTDSQLQAVIDGVSSKLAGLFPTAAAIAAANADEEAKRLGNG